MTKLREAESLLALLPPGARIAVIRIRSLGDCVLTTPAIAMLKTHRPDLKIDIVVEPRFAGVFAANPCIDRVLSAISRQPAPPDLVLNLHGGTRSMRMTLGSGAKFRAGFAHHSGSFIYSHKIPRAQEIIGVERPVHTAEHVASAMLWLGVPQSEIPRAKLYLETPAISTSGPQPVTKAYAVVHPFASSPEKTWPAERFVALARQLQTSESGLDAVVVAGPADDASPFSEFRVIQAAPLSEVKQWMSGAALFVGNDSGPAHIAAAFGVPVVALFGPSDPVTWAPWRTESEVLVSKDSIAAITLDQVVRAAESFRVKA